MPLLLCVCSNRVSDSALVGHTEMVLKPYVRWLVFVDKERVGEIGSEMKVKTRHSEPKQLRLMFLGHGVKKVENPQNRHTKILKHFSL